MVTFLTFLTMIVDLAWDQAPHCGKKEKKSVLAKKKSASEASREVVSPSPGHRSARFAHRYFSYLTQFFAFFSHCKAISAKQTQEDGNYLIIRTFNFLHCF